MIQAGLTCRTFDKEQLRTIQRLSLLANIYMEQQAQELVDQAGLRPLLHHYSSDATSYLTTVREAVAGPDTPAVSNRQRELSKFLCERSFFTYTDDAGVRHGAIVMMRPRSLQKGTTAWHEFAAAEKAFELPKVMGHRGITLSHYCFDRAGLSAISSLLAARHEVWAQEHLANPARDATQVLKDWVLATGCALHDASKALQWALIPWVEDKQMLKDLHVVIESCRNSWDLLVEYIPTFLIQYLERDDTPYDKEACAQWWRCIGAGADWVDVLVDVNPFFHLGKLRVSAKIGGKTTPANLVGDCMVYIMKLSMFCQTRWLTVGKSCRSLVASLSVGLAELGALALRLTRRGETKLHGIKKLNDDIRWYAAVACVATYVPEAFMLEVAEDDRVCRRIEELERTTFEELEYIFHIPSYVWQRLASVAKSALWENSLRTSCLDAAQVCVGFLGHRVFSAARALPWALTLGDVAKNLEDLLAMEGPLEDPTARKIKQLIELGSGCRNPHTLQVCGRPPPPSTCWVGRAIALSKWVASVSFSVSFP